MPELEEAILHRRDARLVKTIEGVLGGSTESQLVAVIYGAVHMRAVTRALMGKKTSVSGRALRGATRLPA